MTIKYGQTITMLKVAAVIGFLAFSLYPLNAHANDRNNATDRYYEEEMFRAIEDSQDPKMAKEIEERQRKATAELQKLKAKAQISRESTAGATTDLQDYSEDMAKPGTTNDVPDSKEIKKDYKYDNKKPGTAVPLRLFNNVR